MQAAPVGLVTTVYGSERIHQVCQVLFSSVSDVKKTRAHLRTMPCLMVEYAHVMSAGPGATLIPILLLFFLSQKYFFHGIEDGGLRF